MLGCGLCRFTHRQTYGPPGLIVSGTAPATSAPPSDGDTLTTMTHSSRPDVAARNRTQHKGSFRYEDAAWMRAAYVERGLSMQQVADEAECGLRTVARWMEIHGIPVDTTRRPRRRTGPDHPRWKGGPPKCPHCGRRRAYYATTCMACKPITGSSNPNWRGTGVGYTQAHERIRRLRGPASTYQCAHCTARADDWAYDHADPDERRELGKRDAGPYSLDPDHYVPLCTACHMRFDSPRRPAQPRRPPAHGTPTSYLNHGCRCDPCREAAREYRKQLRYRHRPRG